VIYRRLLVLAAALLAPSSANAQGAALPPFLELRVPKPPTIATGDGASFLAHEMHLTNFATQPMTLKRVEVATVDSGGSRPVLLTVADSALPRSLTRPGASIPPAERTTVAGGARAVVWLWLVALKDGIPEHVPGRTSRAVPITLETVGGIT
jgi:hypothetical protein